MIFFAHLLQIAVIELQGDNNSHRLSTTAMVSNLHRLCFQCCKKLSLTFSQLSFAQYTNSVERVAERPNIFVSDFKELSDAFLVANALTPDDIPPPFPQMDTVTVAFWNPCVGGMILLYTVFFQNLYVGYLNHLFSQLQAVLHLSHAQRERGAQNTTYPVVSLLEELVGHAKLVSPVSLNQNDLSSQDTLNSGAAGERAFIEMLPEIGNLQGPRAFGSRYQDCANHIAL